MIINVEQKVPRRRKVDEGVDVRQDDRDEKWNF